VSGLHANLLEVDLEHEVAKDKPVDKADAQGRAHLVLVIAYLEELHGASGLASVRVPPGCRVGALETIERQRVFEVVGVDELVSGGKGRGGLRLVRSKERDEARQDDEQKEKLLRPGTVELAIHGKDSPGGGSRNVTCPHY